MLRAKIILALVVMGTFAISFASAGKGKPQPVGFHMAAAQDQRTLPAAEIADDDDHDIDVDIATNVGPHVAIGDVHVAVGVGPNFVPHIAIDDVAVDVQPNVDVDVDSEFDGGRHHDSDYSLSEQETINKTFNIGAGRRLLDVDNINGSVEVVGGQGDQVQLVVKKTIRAESKDRMEAAKKEVTLDITDQPELLKFYVNGPFRCNCDGDSDGCRGGHGDRGDRGYEVTMDFQLQVPRNIDIKLKTVNGGHVNVRNVTGKFSVNNVNGRIEMQDIAGSGRAHTVNGPVKVSFRENPKENSSFATINGDVDLHFVKGLSADFRFKTFNGNVFSDFEMTSLPAHNASAEQRNGKFVFRSDRFTGGRIGSGGPEIKAENLNGNIRVLENHE